MKSKGNRWSPGFFKSTGPDFIKHAKAAEEAFKSGDFPSFRDNFKQLQKTLSEPGINAADKQPLRHALCQLIGTIINPQWVDQFGLKPEDVHHALTRINIEETTFNYHRKIQQLPAANYQESSKDGADQSIAPKHVYS